MSKVLHLPVVEYLKSSCFRCRIRRNINKVTVNGRDRVSNEDDIH